MDYETAQHLLSKGYMSPENQQAKLQNRALYESEAVMNNDIYEPGTGDFPKKNPEKVRKAQKYAMETSVQNELIGLSTSAPSVGGYINPAGGYVSPAGGYIKPPQGGFPIAALAALGIPIVAPLISKGIGGIIDLVKSRVAKQRQGKGMGVEERQYPRKAEYTPDALMRNFPLLRDIDNEIYQTTVSGGNFWQSLWSGVKKAAAFIGPKILDALPDIVGQLGSAVIQAKLGKGKLIAPKYYKKVKKGGSSSSNSSSLGAVLAPIIKTAIDEEISPIIRKHNLESPGEKLNISMVMNIILDGMESEASDILSEDVFDLFDFYPGSPDGSGKRLRKIGSFFKQLKDKAVEVFTRIKESPHFEKMLHAASDAGAHAIKMGISAIVAHKLDKMFDEDREIKDIARALRYQMPMAQVPSVHVPMTLTDVLPPSSGTVPIGPSTSTTTSTRTYTPRSTTSRTSSYVPRAPPKASVPKTPTVPKTTGKGKKKEGQRMYL
jgi:hypothetical protein